MHDQVVRRPRDLSTTERALDDARTDLLAEDDVSGHVNTLSPERLRTVKDSRGGAAPLERMGRCQGRDGERVARSEPVA